MQQRDLCTRLLFQSERLTIADTACSGSAAPQACRHVPAGAESSRAIRLIITRAGTTSVNGTWGLAPHVVSDPARLLLLGASHGSAVEHRGPGVYRCTTIALDPGRCEGLIAPPHDATFPAAAATLIQFHRLRRHLLRQHRPLWGDGSAEDLVEDHAITLVRAAVANYSTTAEAGRSRGHEHGARVGRNSEAARRRLAEAPGDRHELPAIASHLGISASHLAHVFRAEMGLPIH